MRTSLTLGLLAALFLASSARADEAPTVTLEVGESRSFGGFGARCDDLTVASITPNGANITGQKPGKTVCGWAVGHAGGARTWVNVVVVPKSDEKDPKRAGTK